MDEEELNGDRKVVITVGAFMLAAFVAFLVFAANTCASDETSRQTYCHETQMEMVNHGMRPIDCGCPK